MASQGKTSPSCIYLSMPCSGGASLSNCWYHGVDSRPAVNNNSIFRSPPSAWRKRSVFMPSLWHFLHAITPRKRHFTEALEQSTVKRHAGDSICMLGSLSLKIWVNSRRPQFCLPHLIRYRYPDGMRKSLTILSLSVYGSSVYGRQDLEAGR